MASQTKQTAVEKVNEYRKAHPGSTMREALDKTGVTDSVYYYAKAKDKPKTRIKRRARVVDIPLVQASSDWVVICKRQDLSQVISSLR